MTHIEFSPNFGTDIDLPPEYEHSHEFPADPQSFLGCDPPDHAQVC
jgi:hypothetical protein